MRFMKYLLASLLVVFSLSYTFVLPVAADSGQARQDVCAGITNAGGSCSNSGEAEISKVIKLVIQIISTIAGVAAVIMVIVGGLKYITSGGDASKVTSAKSSITYALIGLVIVALSQLIVRYVLRGTVTAR